MKLQSHLISTKNVTMLVLVLVPSQLLSSPLSTRESDFPPPVDPSCFPGLCCRYCINLPSLFPLAGMPRAMRHPCPMRRNIDTSPEGGRFPHSCEILLSSSWLGPTGGQSELYSVKTSPHLVSMPWGRVSWGYFPSNDTFSSSLWNFIMTIDG